MAIECQLDSSPARLYRIGEIGQSAGRQATVQPDQLSSDLASLRIDRSPKKRDDRRGGFPRIAAWLIAIGGLAALAIFVGYPIVKSRFLDTVVQTDTVKLLSPAQSQVELTATGYVQAQISAKVAAKVPGRISEIKVVEGQTIEKGQEVARLEDTDHRSALAAARSRAQVARARIQTARATLAEARTALAREQQAVLAGVSPKATAEDLETRVASLVSAVRAAEAEAGAADADTKSLEIQLANYSIVSPIAGTVVDKLVEVGEGVSPGFGTPGVIEVVDLTSLVVEVDVPETRLSEVRETPPQPCEIVLDAYPEKRYRGEVKEIGRRVNRAKATVPVKIRFLDRPDVVLPEMAARVSLLKEALDDKQLAAPPIRVVPRDAVVRRDGRDVVFVIDGERVRMTTVTVGEEFGGGRRLDTELLEGTKVVLRPSSDLSDGETVKEK